MNEVNTTNDLPDPLKWSHLTTWIVLLPVKPKTTNSEIENVWSAFDANMDRVKAMIVVPDTAVFLKGVLQKAPT
jgi:hypothetical protein